MEVFLALIIFLIFYVNEINGYHNSKYISQSLINSIKLRSMTHLRTSNEPISTSTSTISQASKALKFVTSLSTSLLLTSILPGLKVKNVLAASLESCNIKLSDYGLPPIIFVPPNFTPLVSEYGRGGLNEEMKNPILVQFAHPQLWVVSTTKVNNNGESGTVSANDYIKGDSAYLFVTPKTSEEKLTITSKEIIKNYILKALSQKGDPVESLKIFQISQGSPGTDGQPYIIVDFGYQLNTEAGFLIGRRAVCSLTSVGDGYYQGLIAVTTEKRWRQSLEDTLREVARSFRVYRLNSGIFSAKQ